jgi:hypothetical protein
MPAHGVVLVSEGADATPARGRRHLESAVSPRARACRKQGSDVRAAGMETGLDGVTNQRERWGKVMERGWI